MVESNEVVALQKTVAKILGVPVSKITFLDEKGKLYCECDGCGGTYLTVGLAKFLEEGGDPARLIAAHDRKINVREVFASAVGTGATFVKMTEQQMEWMFKHGIDIKRVYRLKISAGSGAINVVIIDFWQYQLQDGKRYISMGGELARESGRIEVEGPLPAMFGLTEYGYPMDKYDDSTKLKAAAL